MTREELSKIPFKMACHLNMAHEHCTTYEAQDASLDLIVCVHQPYRNGHPEGKSHKHYKWNGMVYESVDELLEAINGL